MSADQLEYLAALAARLSGHGIDADLSTLTLAEASGLFVFLRRLAEAH